MAGRKANMPLNEEEKTQMKSIAGSLAWISRQARPDLCYRTSRVQQMATTGLVGDIKYANKCVTYALETAERGLTFKSGIVDWDRLGLGMVSDASNTGETEVGITPSGKAKKLSLIHI